MGVTWKVTVPGSLDRKKNVVSIEWVESKRGPRKVLVKSVSGCDKG